MPQIKVDYVVSFSSENPEYPASNLLSKDLGNKRWVGQEKGSTSNSVVLQLEKSTQITSVHIGNYHSAFVEVLVGRSEAADKQYEVLLVKSFFMNPLDSRNSVNISNIRTFTNDQLVASVKDQKWDRIRIVCTQPYNRHVQYGLSFIHFFSHDQLPNNMLHTPAEKPSTNKLQSNFLGKFKLKDESDDDSDVSFKPGELFARLKQKAGTSTDSQIRNASSPHNLNKDTPNLLVKASRPSTSNNTVSTGKKDNVEQLLSRKREKILYIDEDDEENEKIDNVIKRDREEKAKNNADKKPQINTRVNIPKTDNNASLTTSKVTVKKESTLSKTSNDASIPVKRESPKDNNSASTSQVKNNVKIENNELKRQNNSDTTAPNKKVCVDKIGAVTQPQLIRGPDCLRGVVFVISGYVNPERSNLRDTALSLGAKYRPDWDRTCTHLICAFPNTPKHRTVLQTTPMAAVVTGQWITECGKEKAHLVWRWFATDPKQRQSRPPPDVVVPVTQPQSSNDAKNNDSDNANNDADMDEDTDDEIEKIIQKQYLSALSANRTAAPKIQMSDESDATDVEDELENKKLTTKKAVKALVEDDESDKTDIEENTSKNNYLTTKKAVKALVEDDESDKTDIEENASKNNYLTTKKAIKALTEDDDSDKTDIEDDTSKNDYLTTKKKIKVFEDSDSDKTDIEDNVSKVKNGTCKNSQSKSNDTNAPNPDCYSMDTDSDSESPKKKQKCNSKLESIPDHFSGITFYIDPNLTDENYDNNLLKRYILAFGGEVVDSWPDKQIDVAITSNSLVDNLRADKGKKCQFIMPEWVWKCNDEDTLYEYEEYVIY